MKQSLYVVNFEVMGRVMVVRLGKRSLNESNKKYEKPQIREQVFLARFEKDTFTMKSVYMGNANVKEYGQGEP